MDARVKVDQIGMANAAVAGMAVAAVVETAHVVEDSHNNYE